ncbi:NAD(P)(+) transhydrogenase (Re/Si-specific) subunit beta [Alkalicella caledoniensis]|uniref:proton-translocating NAD(P)(+) transhydrogenase n=1 Tax=Alkalicella caledoniensis TaxID=2731377 RepID=A0A7G9WBY2_ALKCA|nr:NAD(P)(+) transhydrogenase (Re/Si-specific) subunit beta [Alkalicella caledoniensis]QNO16194.1 NAD(P)(+) transhydrogenase (Re/Si-specific) subunit beta [Alkalicella caledoniensis]
MDALWFYVISLVLSITILYGISLMSQVKTAVNGNKLSAMATALAVLVTLVYNEIFSESLAIIIILACMLIGAFIGLSLSKKVQMIQMPELVALLNGIGGAASAFVAGAAMFTAVTSFEATTGVLALIIGSLTLTGSIVAAGKLSKKIDGRPVIWNNHEFLTTVPIILLGAIVVATMVVDLPVTIILLISIALSGFLGVAFSIRVGGADMPITISLLNSLSGVAGAIAGMAIGNILLVAVGGIVGSSGLLLTQIMCKSMNSSLLTILQGKTSVAGKKTKVEPVVKESVTSEVKQVLEEKKVSAGDILKNAKKVFIVPGYGMALAQAQHLVKQLADTLEKQGTEVKYVIHPVAGRMPGHMNVLLAEADVDYEQLYEMDDVNDEFRECDACVVVGANDVLNPAAREAEGTPIYGMPILNVDKSKHIIFCNYDTSAGYAGVDNPLYSREEGVSLLLGDAAETLQNLLHDVKSIKAEEKSSSNVEHSAGAVLKGAKKVFIVPGYGMALAQAQHLVKQLADTLEKQGTEVKYVIHPVAGRMPGHMNVLLAEADVDYEQLYEMDDVNDEFRECDACVVVGANDVLNPAAREAEGTPIYGMPILNVDKSKHIIFCNYDTSAGYAGVDNPLYSREEGVSLLLGDAAETLQNLLHDVKSIKAEEKSSSNVEHSAGAVLKGAKKVFIVPGYGMALAQAQHLVKQLADTLEKQGTEVKYVIHPVAGRMPGHMNVLLAEADVDYEQLYEMDDVNDEFSECDACVVVGANDVLNPAAREAEGTPIYGMPILNVDKSKHIIFCNYDTSAGYAGVDNPLYSREEGVSLLLGDAAETLQNLLDDVKSIKAEEKPETSVETSAAKVLKDAKKVFIAPGYGMALAQAQHLVKQLADTLEKQGTEVKYVIHPVAGRMPGHMNVLLAEADVDYEQLYEMDDVNDEFSECDACVVVGANDVLNPAAREAEGTPIYGMPILNVDKSKHIIFCNYDTSAGYAGVDNPLYSREEGVSLLLGDAAETLQKLLDELK